MSMLYTIYTESKNLEQVREEVRACFPSFTMYEGVGFWRGGQEVSLTIEILAEDNQHDDHLVRTVALNIKALNKQQKILITKGQCSVNFI